jgi:hypothetical protein
LGNEEELPEMTVEEIQLEANEEIAHAARLPREDERGKRHNGLQDDSGALDDKPRDGALTGRHHPNFYSRRPADRDRLWNWS